MSSTPRFIHGVFSFEGKGLDAPQDLGPTTCYVVPSDKRAQLIYMRGGNSADDLVYLVLTRDGAPLRYFPIGAKSSVHIPLAVVEDIFPDSKLAVLLAAPKGASGTVVIDVGLLEVE